MVADPPYSSRELQQRIADLEAVNRMLRAEAEQARWTLGCALDYAIITLDLSGLVTSWNAGAGRILQYDLDEVLGRSGEVIFTPEDRVGRVFSTELLLALDYGRAANERWHIRRDGTRFWASGVMMPLFDDDGRARGFLNVFRDGSEPHAVAQERDVRLLETQHRLRDIAVMVQLAAAQTGRYSQASRRFRETFGASLVALARSHGQTLVNGTGAD